MIKFSIGKFYLTWVLLTASLIAFTFIPVDCHGSIMVSGNNDTYIKENESAFQGSIPPKHMWSFEGADGCSIAANRYLKMHAQKIAEIENRDVWLGYDHRRNYDIFAAGTKKIYGVSGYLFRIENFSDMVVEYNNSCEIYRSANVTDKKYGISGIVYPKISVALIFIIASVCLINFDVILRTIFITLLYCWSFLRKCTSYVRKFIPIRIVIGY